jgi:hypothetical protein
VVYLDSVIGVLGVGGQRFLVKRLLPGAIVLVAFGRPKRADRLYAGNEFPPAPHARSVTSSRLDDLVYSNIRLRTHKKSGVDGGAFSNALFI